jgi:hypothetical protein
MLCKYGYWLSWMFERCVAKRIARQRLTACRSTSQLSWLEASCERPHLQPHFPGELRMASQGVTSAFFDTQKKSNHLKEALREKVRSMRDRAFPAIPAIVPTS